jgi:hypothetical protein
MSNILPIMARLGRNSSLTNRLATTLNEKLSEAEKHAFFQWLQIVEQDQASSLNREKRKFRF